MRRRRCVPVRGEPGVTLATARRLVERLAPADVLWVSASGMADVGQGPSTRPLRSFLGRGFDAVVLDLHEGLEPDLLGMASGMVRAGGALVLRLPARGCIPTRSSLVVWPSDPHRASRRMVERLERALGAWPELDGPLEPAERTFAATAEQNEAVEALRRGFLLWPLGVTVVTAGRGRGKSSAIGRALADVADAVVVSMDEEGCREVFRFARGLGDDAPLPRTGSPRFASPSEVLALASASAPPTVVAVDEAARAGVPWLRALTGAFSSSHLVFATTTHGYEGSGRGFSLRFLPWARTLGRPWTQVELRTPVRWAADDPLERWIDDLLVLRTEASSLSSHESEPVASSGAAAGRIASASAIVRVETLDRDALARDEALLRELVGLLTEAHYRTTAADLARWLDGSNLSIHVARLGRELAGVAVTAREGSFEPEQARAFLAGRARPRGHALAETLVCHAACVEAGTMDLVRSVRIATRPELRRRGIARRLVEHVHEAEPADMHGTLFGATAELVAFRRSLGYEVVRVGSARGERSGEPSVVMVRPSSEMAVALVEALRRELARNLETQLAFLDAEDPPRIDDALREALGRGLPEVPPYSDEELFCHALAYAEGARPFDADAGALVAFVARNRAALDELVPRSRKLLEARALHRAGWAAAAAHAGFETPAAAMRAMRRALAEFVEVVRAGRGLAVARENSA